jgi:ABC-type uncharacterized transport system permease subunit
VAELLGIYRRLIGARIRSQTQYRLSFALNVIGTALISFLDFAAILILFGQVDALLLIRPLGSLLQVVASDFSLRRLGKGAQGAIVFCACASSSPRSTASAASPSC